jgi:hypothetical protein
LSFRFTPITKHSRVNSSMMFSMAGSLMKATQLPNDRRHDRLAPCDLGLIDRISYAGRTTTVQKYAA